MLFDSHAHINNDTYTEEEREVLIKEMEFLRGSQWIHRVSFSCPHHFRIPPINSSRARS